MKVVIVCSGNTGKISPFITEQAQALDKLGINVDFFVIKGKGGLGYLRNLSLLKKKITVFNPDLIHAHYGLSGMFSNLQCEQKVVITFHGSDAYIPYVKLLSKLAASLSAFNIFVEEKIKNKIKGHKKNAIVPCGVDLDVFYPMNKGVARNVIGLDPLKKYVLFSSGFDNPVKNYPLAISAVNRTGLKIELIELKNRTREEVYFFLNAVDLLLLTSFSEGSPQIIKEAMACNCPIVATDVGDVKEIITDTEGCFITSFDSMDVADKIRKAIDFGKRTNGREKILRFDNKLIAKKIIEIYQKVIAENK